LDVVTKWRAVVSSPVIGDEILSQACNAKDGWFIYILSQAETVSAGGLKRREFGNMFESRLTAYLAGMLDKVIAGM